MTSTWHRETLSIGQQVALKTAAGNLARDEFAGRAVVLNYRPIHDAIERRVRALIDELVPAARTST